VPIKIGTKKDTADSGTGGLVKNFRFAPKTKNISCKTDVFDENIFF